MEEKNVVKLHKEALKFYVVEANSIQHGIFKYTSKYGNSDNEGVHYDYLNKKGIYKAKLILKKYLKKEKEAYRLYIQGYAYKSTIKEYLDRVNSLLNDSSLVIPNKASKKLKLSELNTSF